LRIHDDGKVEMLPKSPLSGDPKLVPQEEPIVPNIQLQIGSDLDNLSDREEAKVRELRKYNFFLFFFNFFL